MQSDPFVSAYLNLANRGNARAQTALGTLFLNGQGDLHQPKQAFYWFQMAAKGGNKLAQFNLGTLYQLGVGTPKNDAKALSWLLKSTQSQQKDNQLTPEMLAWAHLKLGLIFHDGKGTAVDYGKAMKWFSQLTADNHAYGQYMVGQMYEEGRGVQQDWQQAIFWYKAAASQGLEPARQKLASTLAKEAQPPQVMDNLQAARSTQAPKPI
ncbi:MAG: sel1 repeat family protein [Magnetococcales bacterium]|nr:sel1 repeat family protein [Magnetococcales bacterium]